MLMKKALTLAVALTTCTCTWAAPADLAIVSGGKDAATVCVMGKPDGLTKRAIEIFVGRIEERSGVKLPVMTERVIPNNKTLIVLGVHPMALLKGQVATDDAAKKLGPEGYAIGASNEGGRSLITVIGTDSHGLLFGVGALLRHLRFTGKDVSCPALDAPVTAQPWMKERAIYYASHNRNDYHTGKDEDIRRDLEDAALWGINSMWVWMLPVEHYNDISDPAQHETAGLEHWNRILRMMREAKALGMRTGTVLCANVAFLNFVRPEFHATGGMAINPKALVCPSNPDGRAAALRTHDIVFRLAKEAGIEIDGITSFATDTGGCDCEKCKPWLATYLKFTEETAAVARKHYPGLKFYLCNWYWSGKGNILADLNDHPRDWFAGVATVGGGNANLKFGETYAWMNYASSYYYGCLGANPMPERMAKDFKRMKAAGILKVQEYCEGRYQNLNNAFYTRLGWDAEADPKAVFAEYARWHFGVSDDAAKDFGEAVVLIEKETPWFGQHRFAPESSKTIYDAMKRCEARRADWPRERYYWDLFALRATTGYDARQMGTADELRALKDKPDAKRLAEIKAAVEELSAVTNSFTKNYGYCTTALVGVGGRYEAVWGKPHTFQDWQAAWKALGN